MPHMHQARRASEKHGLLRYPLLVSGLALLMVAGALIGKLIAIPPGNVAVFWPPAGIALGIALVLGYRYFPAIWLGSFLFNNWFFYQQSHTLSPTAMLVCVGIATGSTLQGLLGAWLVRCCGVYKQTGWRMDAVLKSLLLAGPLACLLAASFGVGSLLAGGAIPYSAVLDTWTTWWFGDSMGVMMVGGLLLTIYQPDRNQENYLYFERRQRLWPIFSVALVLWCIVGTLWAWLLVRAEVDRENDAHFRRLIRDAENRIEDRLSGYQSVLHGAAGLLYASSSITPQDWRDYTQALDLQGQYPGILGLGYVARVSASGLGQFLKTARNSGGKPLHSKELVRHDLPEHFVIQYIEPAPRNKAAIGLDLNSEAQRSIVAAEARDTGMDRVSGKIQLVQHRTREPGFLLLYPIYRKNSHPVTVQQRRQELRGWVYAPFVGVQIFSGVIPARKPEVAFSVYDGPVSDETLVFSSPAFRRESIAGPETRSRKFAFAGREWTLVWQKTPYFLLSHASQQSTLILFFGVLLTILLSALLVSLNAGRNRALALARELNAEIGKTKEQMELALEAAQEGLWDWAMETDDVYYSSRWCEILGYQRHEIEPYARTFYQLLHPDDAVRLREVMDEHIAGRIPRMELEFRMMTRTGEWKWVLSRCKIVRRDAEGRPLRMLGVLKDISGQKAMEAQLLAANEEARNASRLKSEFLANMSHEIRTPLNGILGISDILMETALSEEQRKYVQMLNSSGVNLLRVINDILDLSKIEAGKMELEPYPFDFRDSMAETMNLFSQKAFQRNLELLFRVRPDVPDRLVGDLNRLRQILINLVGNALKFTEQGEICLDVELVSAEESDVTLHFMVRDTGIGMSEEQQARVFEAFIQADGSTSRKFGGTGLGLSISKSLVEMMQGKLWIESRPQEGSTFHFTVRLGLQGDSSSPNAALPVGTLGLGALRGMPVLVVDDNPTSLAIMEELLHAWKMKPTVANNAVEALAALNCAWQAHAEFRLVILDADMPDMNGLMLAKRIRHDEAFQDTPLVLLTPFGWQEDAQRCRELGIRRALIKPVSPSELLNALYDLFALTPGDDEFSSGDPLSLRRLAAGTVPLRILLAEDNEVNRIVAMHILKTLGHEVTHAVNGQDALLKLREGRFDLILMDIQMPEMDGFEATRAIREQEQVLGGHIPIVALTANALKGDRERCLSMGMDGYVPKPFQAEDLVEAIDAAMAVAKQPPEQASPPVV